MVLNSNEIEIKPSEIICDKCNGIGNFGHTTEIIEYEIRGMVHRIPGAAEYELCPKCKGAGKLDWIEQVVGKNCIMMKPGVYTKEVDHSLRLRYDSDGDII